MITKDWIQGIGHSPVCQIMLQIVSQSPVCQIMLQIVVRLHLHGQVLLECCQLQLTPLSLVNILQPPLLCEGCGSRPLFLSRGSSVLMDLHWPCDCIAQSSILSIGSVSVVLQAFA